MRSLVRAALVLSLGAAAAPQLSAEPLSWVREIERLDRRYREVVAQALPEGLADHGEAVVNL